MTSAANRDRKRAVAEPDLPHHRFPEPYARLMRLGEEYHPEAYNEIAAELRESDAVAAAGRLADILLDDSFYDYAPLNPAQTDPREFTRNHAADVLVRLGDAARGLVDRLVPLLNCSDDDDIAEMMPNVFGAIGSPALAPMVAILEDDSAEPMDRIYAGEAIEEIGERHPECRQRAVQALERTLVETDDAELAGFLITDLMDLGSVESVAIIKQAFDDERVDEMVVQMIDVETHFHLPLVSSRKDMKQRYAELGASLPGDSVDDAAAGGTDGDDEVRLPYIAPEKVGRNEPCPCGSGKKYKKCCGS